MERNQRWFPANRAPTHSYQEKLRESRIRIDFSVVFTPSNQVNATGEEWALFSTQRRLFSSEDARTSERRLTLGERIHGWVSVENDEISGRCTRRREGKTKRSYVRSTCGAPVRNFFSPFSTGCGWQHRPRLSFTCHSSSFALLCSWHSDEKKRRPCFEIRTFARREKRKKGELWISVHSRWIIRVGPRTPGRSFDVYPPPSHVVDVDHRPWPN